MLLLVYFGRKIVHLYDVFFLCLYGTKSRTFAAEIKNNNKYE